MSTAGGFDHQKHIHHLNQSAQGWKNDHSSKFTTKIPIFIIILIDIWHLQPNQKVGNFNNFEIKRVCWKFPPTLAPTPPEFPAEETKVKNGLVAKQETERML